VLALELLGPEVVRRVCEHPGARPQTRSTG
jgi:hypothetical protein